MTGPLKILVVDDEPEVRTFFRYLLVRKNYDVSLADCGRSALDLLARQAFDLALVDLKLPDSDGLTLLRRIKTDYPSCEVIIMTGFSAVKSAVEAIQLGAYDYIEKPFDDIAQLEGLIARALDAESRLEDWKQTSERFGFVVGNNPRMRRLVEAAQKIARKNITVLIRGETGTGKEVLARFIHASSHRAEMPFIAVNCGAFTETLLESELFGHEKGAFTGATGLRRGIFEIADQGTLLLDEVGLASPAIQVKLLRVLERNEFLRVGGERPVKTDVRVLAATNADLEEAVRLGQFRQDLLYRLDVASLCLPPLRERREDIPLLANYFLAKQVGANAGIRISPAAMDVLQAYHWPGNLRELANVIAGTTALLDGPVIQPRHLSPRLTATTAPPSLPGPVSSPSSAAVLPAAAPLAAGPDPWAALELALDRLVDDLDLAAGINLPAVLDRIKDLGDRATRKLITRALQQTLGNRAAAADLLTVTPRILRYLLKEKNKPRSAKTGGGNCPPLQEAMEEVSQEGRKKKAF